MIKEYTKLKIKIYKKLLLLFEKAFKWHMGEIASTE